MSHVIDGVIEKYYKKIFVVINNGTDGTNRDTNKLGIVTNNITIGTMSGTMRNDE